jgi:spore maturation protein CgeB
MKDQNSHSREFSDVKLLILYPGFSENWDLDKNVVEPLLEIFPRAVSYNFGDRYKKIGGRSMNRELLELFLSEKPDYVFIHMSVEEIYKSTISRMTNSGVLTIGWFSDDQVVFHKYSKWWGAVLSYCITLGRKSYKSYLQLGINAILSQPAANPKSYHPHPCSRIYDVSFIGALYPHRNEFFQKLSNMGIAINLFGKAGGQYIPFEDMVRIFSESKVNLNLCGSYASAAIKQIKAHIYEITMSGGFLLTEYAPHLEDYFEIGKEIVVFDGVEDAVQKIEYYLNHDDERKEIAKAGYERALRDHTWNCRFRELFDQVEKLESQKRLNNRENSLTDISRNGRMPYWPGKSGEEKKRHEKDVSMFYIRWGNIFLKEGRFITAINEYIYAHSIYPLSIFVMVNMIHKSIKDKLRKAIPEKWRKEIKKIINMRKMRVF